MVEGLVMELYRDYVVVMTRTGEFLKLRKRGIVNVGDIYKEKVYRKIPMFTYAAAAALIFAFTSLAGYTAYANQIVGYVDIKGDRDVRLYVSRNGTVEKVDGIQNTTNIKNLPVDKAIEELNEIAVVEGIYNDSSKVDISTTKLKDSKLDLDKVNENVKKILVKDKKLNDEDSHKTINENEGSIKGGKNSNKDNKDNKDSKKEIKQDSSKNENESVEQVKNKNNSNTNNKDRGNKNNGNIKSSTKNGNDKLKNGNNKSSFFNFINSRYKKIFKNK